MAEVSINIDTIRALMRPRPAEGHKGTFGHALIIAGQYGMAGAALLCAQACLRSGAGKVSLHTPKCNTLILQTALPEAILHHDASEHTYTVPIKDQPYSAVAIGPGIGTASETALAFHQQIVSMSRPAVIDADALNILASHPEWQNQIPAGSILTPHPGEVGRLSGIAASHSDLQREWGCRMASKHNITVVLKGHRTTICTPDGKMLRNTTGNSGMATAGSGDVLTGIIVGLLAQGYSPIHAACISVFLHGLSGDIARDAIGEHSLIASDLIRFLPQAFNMITNTIID